MSSAYNDGVAAVCACCGEQFLSVKGGVYCSKKCANHAAYVRRTERVRLGLGSKFVPETRKCAHCGKEFVADRVTRVTCSKECSDARRREMNAKNNAARRAASRPYGERRKCVVCGKPCKNNFSRYCSDECRVKAGRPPIAQVMERNAHYNHEKSFEQIAAEKRRAAKARMLARDAEYAAAFGADERTSERDGVVTVTRGRIPGGNGTPRPVL